jgi:hypothetical protein
VSAGDAIQGAIVLFEPASEARKQTDEPAFYGCLDALTGIPAQRLTRAVLAESMNARERTKNKADHSQRQPEKMRIA